MNIGYREALGFAVGSAAGHKISPYFTESVPMQIAGSVLSGIALASLSLLAKSWTQIPSPILEAEMIAAPCLEIPSETMKEILEKLETLGQRTKLFKPSEELEWLSWDGPHVFKIKDFPEYVFKQAYGPDVKKLHKRFENIFRAQKICKDYHLDRLVIPNATIVDSSDRATLIEECLDFDPEEHVQQRLYKSGGEELDETVRQLAVFVAKTGFSDVTPRNIPLLNEESNRLPYRVGLIDLEDFSQEENGAWAESGGFMGSGNTSSPGLVRSVANRHIGIVLDEGRKQGVCFFWGIPSWCREKPDPNKGIPSYLMEDNEAQSLSSELWASWFRYNFMTPSSPKE